MTMQEINAALKENFQQQLSEVTDLPEDLANGYKQWVQGLVQAAGQQLSMEAAGSQGQPAPEEGAA